MGFVRALNERIGYPGTVPIRESSDQLLWSSLREQLSEAAIAAASAEGALLTSQEAVAEALAALELEPIGDPASSAARP